MSQNQAPSTPLRLPPITAAPCGSSASAKPSWSDSTSATSMDAGRPSETSAYRGSAPIAATSLRLTSMMRRPICRGVIHSGRKCRPATCASQVMTRSQRGRGRTTAASSPGPTTTVSLVDVEAVPRRSRTRRIRSIKANSPHDRMVWSPGSPGPEPARRRARGPDVTATPGGREHPARGNRPGSAASRAPGRKDLPPRRTRRGPRPHGRRWPGSREAAPRSLPRWR